MSHRFPSRGRTTLAQRSMIERDGSDTWATSEKNIHAASEQDTEIESHTHAWPILIPRLTFICLATFNFYERYPRDRLR